MSSSPSQSLMKVARAAWLVVFLLMPVALLNYLDRQMMSAMKSSVMADIPTIENDGHWGLMLGQFKWVYAFLSPVGGYVGDLLGRKRTICASLFVWSAITFWTGATTTFQELLWARSLMGISEAFYMPAALALIADHHLGPTRSRAIGFHQMAIYLGVILGGFTGYAADAPDIGWRSVFYACGLAGIVYAPVLLLLLPRPSVAAEATSDLGPGPIRALRELLSNGSFLLLVVCFTLPALPAWIVRDWMPAILKTNFQIGQGYAGVSASLYWTIAAIFGAALGGYLADALMARTERGRIFISATGIFLLIPALFGMGNAPTLFAAVVSLALFGLGWGFFDGNNMPILCQVVRPELRATGYGIMNFVSISGGGIADYTFGLLNDRKMPLNGIFALYALFAAISVVLMLCIRPRGQNMSSGSSP